MIQHLCMNIEDAIANAKELKGAITVDGETLKSVKRIKTFLRTQLAMGRKVLPVCRCSNFDYQKGCLGHVKREEWISLKQIGLTSPTVVEYNNKTLVTVGLVIEDLVNTWRNSFNLHDCIIRLITDKSTIDMLSKKLLPSMESITDLLAEYDVYLWDKEIAEL